MLARGERMAAYRFHGYWKDVGTLESLWDANMDMLSPTSGLDLRDESWPIYARSLNAPPTFVGQSAQMSHCAFNRGSEIQGDGGELRALPPGGVGEGARVSYSVVLPGTVVEAGAVVEYAILGEGCHIGRDCRVGGTPESVAAAPLGADGAGPGLPGGAGPAGAPRHHAGQQRRGGVQMNGLHGIIFAYEKRNNLRELAEIRSVASIPFGGRYRVVDFSLSNLVNAGVTDVGVVLHGRYQSMLDHLGTGKDWDLSRKRGGLKILPPFAYKQSWGEAAAFRGKMEALAGVRSYLAEIRRDYVVLMDGDLVVNLPISDIYEQHIKSGADITVVCGNDSFETENGTYFEMDHSTGRITDVLYNLHRPRGYRGLEVYILSTELLLSLVDECSAKDEYSWRRDVLRAKKKRAESAQLHLEGLRRADPLRAGVL